ncbi:hypothetical protein J0J30_23245, partial [Vibrio vulnificus]|nr:hypothetical protein [Vibrio vulnificus]
MVNPQIFKTLSFGCLTYATVTLPHPHKFSLETIKFVFLGYISGEKSYKLYDLEPHNTFVLETSNIPLSSLPEENKFGNSPMLFQVGESGNIP